MWLCFTGVMGSGVTVCDIWLSLCVVVNINDKIFIGYYRHLRFFSLFIKHSERFVLLE